MVEVQMRVDDPGHVFGPSSDLGERVLEQRAAVPPVVAHAVDVAELCVFFVADPRVDQHEAVVVLDQEAAQRERNAVALVGGDASLHSGFGTTPNMAPPSSRWAPASSAWQVRRPTRKVVWGTT